jgi:hypothetical protein
MLGPVWFATIPLIPTSGGAGEPKFNGEQGKPLALRSTAWV